MRPLARSAWTSTEPGGLPLAGPVSDLFIHHTAGAVPLGGVNASKTVEAATIRATREDHVINRGFADIGYCYGFMPSGRVYELRGHRTGGHTFCCNRTSIAFVFFGSSDAVAGPALENAVRMMHEERLRQIEIGNLTANHRIRGHRDVGTEHGSTECPGNALFARLSEIDEGVEDMGFAEYSQAYADRWNKLVAGEARPRVEKIPVTSPTRRDAALGRRQADVDFVTLKALRNRPSG